MVAPTPGVFASLLLGMIQRIAHKQVGLAHITRILGLDLLQRLFKADFVHIKFVLLPQSAVADALPGMFLPPTQREASPE